MKRTLGYDELPLGVVAGYEVGVDVVAALLVVRGLELDPTVVVGQDVGEPVLGPVDRQIRGRAVLVTTNVLQFLVLLAEPEVAICGHDTIVFSEIFQLDRS